MLGALLLSGRHSPTSLHAAAAVAAAAQAAACGSVQQPCPAFCRLLLSTLHASFYSSSSTPLASQAAEIITQAELQAVPQSTVSSDRLLSSTQRESLAIFRRFNISQPQLQGQVILAKVLRSTRQQVLVDPGYYGLNWVSKQELAAATPYSASGQPIQRSSPELLPGDYVKLRLAACATPYGDTQLEPVGIPGDVRAKLVWDELETRMRSGKMVTGRILNVTTKGYAVGVAGYVALLESNHALPETAAQIGTLQPFYVASMDKPRKLIKLSGVRREVADMEEMYRQSM